MDWHLRPQDSAYCRCIGTVAWHGAIGMEPFWAVLGRGMGLDPSLSRLMLFWILTNMMDMYNGSWLALLYGYARGSDVVLQGR